MYWIPDRYCQISRCSDDQFNGLLQVCFSCNWKRRNVKLSSVWLRSFSLSLLSLSLSLSISADCYRCRHVENDSWSILQSICLADTVHCSKGEQDICKNVWSPRVLFFLKLTCCERYAFKIECVHICQYWKCFLFCQVDGIH